MIKVVIEISDGNVVALHSSEEVDFHVVDWDSKDEDNLSWEKGCKQPLGADRYIDKGFDYYMNEVLNA